MPIKTFAPGVLTSSDVNTYLMNQAIITCTSSTRPSSPSEGMTIYETDTDAYVFWNGSTWKRAVTNVQIAYTPTASGTGWALGNGTASGNYTLVGNLAFFNASVVFGSTSTFGTGPDGLQVSLPVARVGNIEVNAVCVDVSASALFIAQGRAVTGTGSVEINVLNTAFANGRIEAAINTKPFTWANGDYVLVSGSYMVA